MESPFSLLVWWAGQADSLQKTLDNVRQQLILYEEFFFFFLFCFSLVGTFCSCSPSYCTLWFAPADFTIVLLLLDALFIPKSVARFLQRVFFFFGNSWILQRAESEQATLKRTISACELYTVLTPCLYSLDLFVHGKRRHFRKRDICHIQPCVCIFMFYGIF